MSVSVGSRWDSPRSSVPCQEIFSNVRSFLSVRSEFQLIPCIIITTLDMLKCKLSNSYLNKGAHTYVSMENWCPFDLNAKDILALLRLGKGGLLQIQSETKHKYKYKCQSNTKGALDYRSRPFLMKPSAPVRWIADQRKLVRISAPEILAYKYKYKYKNNFPLRFSPFINAMHGPIKKIAS